MSIPRIGIVIETSKIQAIWITPGGQTTSIETVPLPTTHEKRRITHSPRQFLEHFKRIPDRFNFSGEWEAAIASSYSTFLLWERKTGKPVTPIVSWRDRRASDRIHSLDDSQWKTLRQISGSRPDASYPFSKLIWFLNNDDEIARKARNGELRYGTLDMWILKQANPDNRYSMDQNRASETLLYNPQEEKWESELLDQFGIPREIFPEQLTQIEYPLSATNIWSKSRIVNCVNDQTASTIGSQPPPYDQTRVSLNSVGIVCASISDENDHPDELLTTTTPTPNEYVTQSLGIVLSMKRAVEWFTRIIGVNERTFQSWLEPPWPESIPLWCPSFQELGAPYWLPRQATIGGLTEESSTRELCLGLTVSLLMRIRDILQVLPKSSEQRILLNGTMSTYNQLPKLASAIWDVPTANTLTPHLPSRGALIASHWVNSYFSGDPWDDINVEVVIPARDAPADAWTDQWNTKLNEWNLDE